MSNKTFSRMLRRWLSHGGRPAGKPGRSHRAHLRVEEVEPRLAPATFTTPLPPPTVTETQALGQGFMAQAAIDPTNPQRMVVFNGIDLTNPVRTRIASQFTLDGGSSWFAGPGSTALPDPTTIGQAYLFHTSPSVAFGRDGTVYLTYL